MSGDLVPHSQNSMAHGISHDEAIDQLADVVLQKLALLIARGVFPKQVVASSSLVTRSNSTPA